MNIIILETFSLWIKTIDIHHCFNLIGSDNSNLRLAKYFLRHVTPDYFWKTRTLQIKEKNQTNRFLLKSKIKSHIYITNKVKFILIIFVTKFEFILSRAILAFFFQSLLFYKRDIIYGWPQMQILFSGLQTDFTQQHILGFWTKLPLQLDSKRVRNFQEENKLRTFRVSSDNFQYQNLWWN